MDYRNAVASKKSKKHDSRKSHGQGKKAEATGETKFREAQLKLQQLVQKHLEDKEASSSDDEDDLETENIFGT